MPASLMRILRMFVGRNNVLPESKSGISIVLSAIAYTLNVPQGLFLLHTQSSRKMEQRTKKKEGKKIWPQKLSMLQLSLRSEKLLLHHHLPSILFSFLSHPMLILPLAHHHIITRSVILGDITQQKALRNRSIFCSREKKS